MKKPPAEISTPVQGLIVMLCNPKVFIWDRMEVTPLRGWLKWSALLLWRIRPHGSEEGCCWLLLQSLHERRQCPFLPPGWAHPALLALRCGHLLSPGAPLWVACPSPLETTAGQFHPEIQGEPGRLANSTAPVRGGKRGWNQGGHTKTSLGLFWCFLLCGHCGLHNW